jgi:hypothetical protein
LSLLDLDRQHQSNKSFNLQSQTGDIPLQNTSLSQIIQSDRIFTIEMTLDLVGALLQAQIDSAGIDGHITPDRVLIVSVQPTRIKILPAEQIHVDPEFSAPEILDGKITPSSDLYSIGLIAIYLLTGIRPFQLFDTANRCWVWQDYWQHSLPRSRVNYHQLATMLDRAIDLDPDLRFNSATEMMIALSRSVEC